MLGDPGTAEARIAPLKIADELDQLWIRTFRTRFARARGGIEEPVLEIAQCTMEAEQGSGTTNEGAAEESARLEQRGAKSQEETVRGRETRRSPTVSVQD